MATKNLLVPGTGGITFQDNLGNDLGYPVKLRLGVISGGLIGKSTAELQQLLSMSHVPGQWAPAQTSLSPGVSIEPGHVLQVAYNQIPTEFENFLYDWRADLRFNAQRLCDFLRKTPAGTKWNLVGHSQGGLLIILASKLMDTHDEFSKYVQKVFLVAVPIAGTVNAALALLKGDQVGDDAAPVFKSIVRTWPALYQMMPAWPMVYNDDKTPVKPQFQHFNPSGWTGHADISADFLTRMQETQERLKNPLSRMVGVETWLMMARNRNTVFALERKNSKLTPNTIATQQGDGLVPFLRTVKWIGEHILPRVIDYESGVNEHAFLLDDPFVVGQIKKLL